MTVEEKVQLLVGKLMTENFALAAKVEELQKLNAELQPKATPVRSFNDRPPL